MKIIELKIKALEQLILTDKASSGMSHITMQHIPGNMLLGAYASAWKRMHKGLIPDDSAEFCSFFLNGDVEWGNAYPAAGDKACIPTPLSFVMEKNASGLPVYGSKNTNCVIFNKSADRTEETLDIKRDQKKTKKVSAPYIHPETFCIPDITSSWNMHVAIGENRKAADSQLFGYSSLPIGTAFISRIFCQNESLFPRLKEFIAKVSGIFVGHSRSAGYGKVSVTAEEIKQPFKNICKKEEMLFLLSDYVPSHSWEQPMESLERELRAYLGDDVEIAREKLFCKYNVIAGYNAFWNMPAPTVTALSKGSVLCIRRKSDTEKELPLSLGGRLREGYGRILVDPDFLKDAELLPKAVSLKENEAKTVTISSPLCTIWRKRSLDRIIQSNAANAIRDIFSPFIETVTNSPSSSQRGNIRYIISEFPQEKWRSCFNSLLSKTPGQQWRRGRARNPFPGPNWETLDVIMLDLLDSREFMKLPVPKAESLSLPGGKPPDKKEMAYYNEQLHKTVLLYLLKAWNMQDNNKKVNGGD